MINNSFLRAKEELSIFLKKWWFQIILASIGFIFFLMGSVSGESFDDASIAQHGQFFYDMNINPLIYQVQGAYYTWISIGGYSIAIILQSFGYSNIITMQSAVKFPIILFALFSSFFIYSIAKNLNVPKNKAKIITLLFLTEPVLFYVAAIHGIPLVISMFFLISSIAFLQKGRNLASAVLYGVSCASYLYPIFAVPFLLRFIWKRNDLKASIGFTSILAISFLIGFVPSLMLYKLAGIALSYGSSATVVSSFFSSVPLPGYSFFDFLYLIPPNGLIHSSLLNISFILSMGLSSMLLAIIPRSSFFKFENLILFLTIQALLFIFFNPANAPQYLYAVSPLLLLCSVVLNNDILLAMLSFATLFDFLALITWNPTALLGLFFADTYPRLLSFSQTFPFNLYFFLSFIYGIIILAMIIYISYRIIFHLKLSLGNNEKEYQVKNREEELFYTKSSARIKYNFTTIVLVTVVVFFLVSPGFASLPNNFLQMNQINEQQVTPNLLNMEGSQIYIFAAPYLSIVDSKYYHLYNGTIDLKSYNPAIYNWFVTNASFPLNKSEALSETVEFPFEISNLSLMFDSSGKLSEPLYLSISGPHMHLDNIEVSSNVFKSASNNDYLYFNVSGDYNAGHYTFSITTPSNSTIQIIGSINNHENYTKKYTEYVANLTINKRIVNGSSLALLITGIPVFKIGGNVLSVIKKGNEYALNVRNTDISSPLIIHINGTFDYSMSLVLYLPSSRYINLWKDNPSDLVIGIFMLASTAWALIYLVRKVRQK